MVLQAEKLISGGDALARVEEKSVFIPGLLPGETAEVKITLEKSGFNRAEALEILTPSPHRRSPPCPWAGECGGCAWQHMEEDFQRSSKAALVQEAFRRLGGTEIPLPDVVAGKPWGYRNRIQVHKTKDGRVGFKSQGSPEVVPVEACLVAASSLSRWLTGINRDRKEAPLPDQDRFLVFGLEDQLWIQGNSETVSLEIKGKILNFSLDGFFQSNLELLPELVEEVVRLAGKGNQVLDLYGGVGLFGAFLAESFQQVTVVEVVPQALELARTNVPRGKFFSGEVEAWLGKNPGSPDCVVVDPPRTGLSEKVRRALVKMASPRIVYVSCNPDTMARDSRDLAAGGYRRESLKVFDFYPQTPHIEAVGLWIRD